jgi:hypothetical protein
MNGRPQRIKQAPETRFMRGRVWIAGAMFAVMGAASAQEAEEESKLKLNGSLKATSLAAHNPNDPRLFPDDWTGTGLLRLRVNANVLISETARADFAYEHRAQYVTSTGAGGGGVLPSLGQAPYRLTQLDWQIARSDDEFFYRHEIDRASLTLTPAWGRVVIGRQGIGLGRGTLFSAVDMFSPFSPQEVDREWRRGVDALRIEKTLTDTVSAEMIGVFGRSWDDSALLGRVRGFVGNVDGELILGKRAEDYFVAGVTSAVVGDAEVHFELALFNTPEDHPDGGLFGNDNLIAKAVLGSSYTFDIGNGLTILGEYHYNGFGVEETSDINQRLRDTTFQERLLRGDFQTLGQHALGLQASYIFNETFAGGLLFLNNPEDGSGLFAPSLNWDLNDNSSLRFSVFLPWGAEPDRGRIRSEYGSTPSSLFVQFSTYF